MESEDKRKLDRILELSEDNNSMLKKLVRAMRWAKLIRVVYIIIIVGSAVGIFYFMQPFVDQILGTYGGFKDSISNFNNAFQ
jgi:Trk-type K+ transport system membrane component